MHHAHGICGGTFSSEHTNTMFGVSAHTEMPESNDKALKHALGRHAVRCVARNMARVSPGFRTRAFTQRACRGLDDLELKARVLHIAEALRASLPDDPLAAVDVIVSASDAWKKPAEDGYGFAAWPVIELVGELARPYPAQGLEALRRVTGLFTAEFAIRGFLEDDMPGTMKVLKRWLSDPDAHVRRLVSEGTRPRLPWGIKVRALIENPKPGLQLLERLKDDDSESVRRSVANHLNDVAKDHRAMVTDVCRRWAPRATAERNRLIRHALRTLVKQGDACALEILGFDPRANVVVVDLVVEPCELRLGQSLALSFKLVSKARVAHALVVDYAVHHVKKSGNRTQKTFKLKTLTLAAGASASIGKRHTIRKISTRTYHSGRHTVDILVNGQLRGSADFELKV